jgi:hypothetical protein
MLVFVVSELVDAFADDRVIAARSRRKRSRGCVELRYERLVERSAQDALDVKRAQGKDLQRTEREALTVQRCGEVEA